MKLETYRYTAEGGWETPLSGALDSETTFVLVFMAPEYSRVQGPVMEIVDRFPNSHVVGCSTSGEILGGEILDGSLSVSVAQFEKSKIKSVLAEAKSPEESFTAGQCLAVQLDAEDLRAVFVLADGLTVNGTDLIRGVSSALTGQVSIVGGLAADKNRFEKTFVLSGGEILSGAACAVGFYGDGVRTGASSKAGWDRFGHNRLINKSTGNILHELDGRPALEVYKQYLGDRSHELPFSSLHFPMQVRKTIEDDRPLVRTVLGVDEKSNSLIFAGEVTQGYFAQLLYGNFDRLIASARSAAVQACEHSGPEPLLAIAVSCAGRRLVLRDRTEEEVEAIAEELPKRSNLVGFYAYGEIGPVGSSSFLHNETMTMLTLSEAA